MTSGSARKKGAHGCGKRKAHLGMDLDLTQAVLRNFNWIFCGPNLDIRRVDTAQNGMQGWWSFLNRWSNTQDNTVRLVGDIFEFLQISIGETPSFSSGSGSLAARIRITTSSLYPAVGMVATRSSISRFSPILNLILPS